MDLVQIARLIDLLALAFVVGSTSWFFFVQSPGLLARMGREAFVPLQMRVREHDGCVGFTPQVGRVFPTWLPVPYRCNVVNSSELRSRSGSYSLQTQ